MGVNRLQEIKKRDASFLAGTKLEEDWKWLIQQAEKAEKYEETLKYIQFQLKNGGKGKRERISDAVDKALEGIT